MQQTADDMNIHDQYVHRKVVCLFKQETSEGARWPLWKRGRNRTTRPRQPANQLRILRANSSAVSLFLFKPLSQTVQLLFTKSITKRPARLPNYIKKMAANMVPVYKPGFHYTANARTRHKNKAIIGLSSHPSS